jgi:hypothetical protein
MRKYGLLFFLALLAIPAAARADVLVDTQELDGQQVTGVSFDSNPKMGRAWINIDYYYSSLAGSDTDPSTSVRAKVPGLALSREAGVVTYQAHKDAAPVVCAKFVKHWWGTRLEGTGVCGVTRTETITKVTDDGYETHEKKYMQVYFGVLATEGRRGE